MNLIVLFRETQDTEEEHKAIDKYFYSSKTRIGLEKCLVIGRYSVLPFYRELEADLALQNSRLINSFAEHDYIASFDWYRDVPLDTPKTWFSLEEVDHNAGPFVLKGKTNSRKNEWRTKMYADTYLDAARIYCDLSIDPLLQDQGIIIRKYGNFLRLDTGVNGQPFLNEHRLFFYKETLLSHGFYWTQSEVQGELTQEGIDFAKRVAKVIAKRTTFFVLDIAQLEHGAWMLIEVNDGQMSGLSGNDPDVLYGNLKTELTREE